MYGLPSLKSILKVIRKELKIKERVKEKTQTGMRKMTSLSKQAILLIHQKRVNEAKRLLEKAKEALTDLEKVAEEYPESLNTSLFNAALQEYAEAKIFLTLVEQKRFATPKEINVPSLDYVLGLADVIGECRRLALDSLREGTAEKSEWCLKIMDEIYTELMAMDEAYMLVPGLRRKCDVARKIIETTRGDLTHEVRMEKLEKLLKNFEMQRQRKRKEAE